MANLQNVNFLRSLFGGMGSKAGRADEDAATYWTTPWRWRDAEGVYVGHNKEVWLYRQLTVAPLRWEDPERIMAAESPLASLLYELGETSRDLGVGIKSLSKNREIHLLAVTWDKELRPPDGTPPSLADFLNDFLRFSVPDKALFIGVKLWPSLISTNKSGKNKSVVSQLVDRATTVMGEDVPELAQFEADRKIVSEICRRNGAGKVPDRHARAQLESWYNLGRSPDAPIYEAKDLLYIDDVERIEVAAVVEFEQQKMYAPNAQWALDAATHEAAAAVISVRGEIEPPAIARTRLRRSQRRVNDQIEQEAATGDIERPEQSMTLELAQEVERFILTGREPLVTNTSILLARRVGPEVAETYIDELRGAHGIECKPLEMRQLDSVDEMLPTSSKRVNPFVQDVSVSMLAYAGLQGFSRLGDSRGVFCGLADPDYTPVWLDPLGAPAADKAPAMLIAGRPGSGKAQPLDAKVLTPAGWTTMGEITVGSEVIGSDGKAHRVLGVFPQGVRPIYRVTMTDGASTEADEDHLWQVLTPQGSKLVTTGDMVRSGTRHPSGQAKFRVPVVEPVQFEASKPLPLNPYVLGALIGDGYLPLKGATPSISSGDAGMFDILSNALDAHLRLNRVAPAYDCARWSITGHRPVPRVENPAQKALRDLGLAGVKSPDRFIPPEYKTASVEDRIALLQGLMDTDGSVNLDGCGLRFRTTSRRLADDVVELVQLLGGTGRLSSMPARTSRYRDGVSYTRESFSVSLRLPSEIIPFRLQRKLDRYHGSPRRYVKARVVASVERIEDKPAQCILIDSDDHLYVTDGGIVVHNTFLGQLICIQAVLGGQQTIVINPKGFSSLGGLLNIVPGKRIGLSEVSAGGGFFDPFRFTKDPSVAADIAINHILMVLGSRGVAGQGFTQSQEIALTAGIREGAMAGARCVAEALAYVRDNEVQMLVRQQAEDPLFRLGIGLKPQAPFQADEGLLLIEFDRPLDLPESGTPPSQYTRNERLAMAAVKLATRASMEVLANARGGVLFVDEAWMFLQSSDGLAAIQSLGRLGRSQNILPIFATQRVDDLLRDGVDMEDYLSRVFVMELNDEREQKAALKLLKLEATPHRLNWLSQAGPRQASEDGRSARPAYALHRDLQGRHAALMVGPTPDDLRKKLSTNPLDQEERRRADGPGA